MVITLLICVLLGRELGFFPTLAGAGTLLVFIVLQVHYGRRFGQVRRKTASLTDARVKVRFC